MKEMYNHQRCNDTHQTPKTESATHKVIHSSYLTKLLCFACLMSLITFVTASANEAFHYANRAMQADEQHNSKTVHQTINHHRMVAESFIYLDKTVKDFPTISVENDATSKHVFQLFSHDKLGALYIEGEWKDTVKMFDSYPNVAKPLP